MFISKLNHELKTIGGRNQLLSFEKSRSQNNSVFQLWLFHPRGALLPNLCA